MYSLSFVHESGVAHTWLLNPLEDGPHASLDALVQHFGSRFCFPQAYRVIMKKPLQNPRVVLHEEMEAFHDAVKCLPTIDDVAEEIKAVAAKYSLVTHFFGRENSILEALDCSPTVVNLGAVLHNFLHPVRKLMNHDNLLSGSGTCVLN